MERFDVIGLGAGSACSAVARAVASAGLSVALVEAALVGGECPFVACIPSKALLRSAQVRHLMARGVELGARSLPAAPAGDGRAESDFTVAVTRRDQLVDHRDDSAKAGELAGLGVRVLRGRGRVGRPGVVVVDGVEYGYGNLVVGTGSFPIWPPIDGLDRAPTWTSDQALVSTERPRSLAILGAGAVGCELAQVYARFGTAVTLIDSGPGLLPAEEPSISARLGDVLAADGVELRFGAQVTGVEACDGGARVEFSTGAQVISERVLVATGRAPNTGGIGLETLGVDVGDGGLAIDDTCRVHGQDHLWAAGDVTAVAPYTHTAVYQAGIVATNILAGHRNDSTGGGPARADYRAVPRAVYTDPAVASVGIDEATAANAGIASVTAALDLGELARSGVDSDSGRLVLTADRSRRVLIGAAAIGPHADEWIGEAALAVHAELPLAMLTGLVHLFPTYSEAYGRLFRELSDQANKPVASPVTPGHGTRRP
ncbi:MAG: NAD(P)/FAD-dependent oxidoreductase [Actinomycetota bacterium]|nr:NAD(P)/FAD-dependent oxidoreductase [Actinomycetota bacterium]